MNAKEVDFCKFLTGHDDETIIDLYTKWDKHRDKRSGQFEQQVTLQPNTFLNADCMEYLTKCPDNYFDLAIVDPPYGIGMAKWDTKPNKAYFDELMRISKKQIIWGGNYFGLPTTEGWLCWNKISGFAKAPLETMADFELAWTSFLDKAKLINLSCSGNIINGRVDYTYKPIHPTQKPVDLYKILLKKYAGEGDLILDTHVGSASSLIACKELGFDYVGFEIDKEYYEQASKRLEGAFRKYELEL